MTGGKKLQLGTAALMAQSTPISIALPIERPIERPDQIVRGAEVWIYFRVWRRGVVSRVVPVDPRRANHGTYQGNRAIVLVGERSIAVRRLLRELIPTALLETHPLSPDREAAQQFAGSWWNALASSL